MVRASALLLFTPSYFCIKQLFILPLAQNIHVGTLSTVCSKRFIFILRILMVINKLVKCRDVHASVQEGVVSMLQYSISHHISTM